MNEKTKVVITYPDGFNHLSFYADFTIALQSEIFLATYITTAQYRDIHDIAPQVLATQDEDLYNEFIEEVDNLMEAFEHLAFVEEDTWAKENGLV